MRIGDMRRWKWKGRKEGGHGIGIKGAGSGAGAGAAIRGQSLVKSCYFIVSSDTHDAKS